MPAGFSRKSAQKARSARSSGFKSEQKRPIADNEIIFVLTTLKEQNPLFLNHASNSDCDSCLCGRGILPRTDGLSQFQQKRMRDWLR